MTNSYLTLESVSFVLPGGLPLFSQLSETFDSRPTGLVGPNGVGKSVLAQIMAAKLAPSSGRCTRSGCVFYLPQQISPTPHTTVAELAGVQPIIEALSRIEHGSTSAVDFDLVGNNWNIHQQLLLQLKRCGLRGLHASTPAHRLSGGEAMRVALAGAWLCEADFMILDEPSNHLDHTALLQLITELHLWHGGLLVVSHDRVLLESMARVVELSPSGLNNYGGNYSFYSRQKRHETENALHLLRQRKHERQREQKNILKQKACLEQRQSRGNRQRADANQAKILLGRQKQRSETSAGKVKLQHSERLEQLNQQVRDASSRVGENAEIVLHSPSTNRLFSRHLAELSEVQLPFISTLFPSIELEVTGQARIGIVGRNGSGKSTLLKVIAGQLQPLSGHCRTTDAQAWLDQHLTGLDPHRSVLEQVLEANQTAGEATLRMRLAQLGLDAAKIQQPAVSLSGGERVKATLACKLYADPAPRLLLLDEPSNHLDLTSIRALETMLDAWNGALIVVSHDRFFLENLHLTLRLTLEGNSWRLEPW
ncbi:ATP-binding cassette domain-containing protein [Enterobacteriaceae bacterium RIT693]|nr:ATP-binding cassette domain-containing protein [Enterobacteriaceae bacterium RIT693]